MSVSVYINNGYGKHKRVSAPIHYGDWEFGGYSYLPCLQQSTENGDGSLGDGLDGIDPDLLLKCRSQTFALGSLERSKVSNQQ